ncbi:MAG: Holliday junction branch migration DNA helicase RuvB [Planctomycetota bacterium]
MQGDHVFHPGALGEEVESEQTLDAEPEFSLRPQGFGEFVGQDQVVQNLQVAIGAAQSRSEPLDHVLFSGPPGLGKTSLARLLAAELGVELHSTSGPALSVPKDLVGILTHLKRGDVLFIDEIHRVPATVEEYLYTAMEDYSIDFTLETGPNARILPLPLERFTLVGATTREGLLTAPFRARFGLFERLRPYATAELGKILHRSAALLDLDLEERAAELLASRSRGTPRIANRFLRRARDLAQFQGSSRIDAKLAEETLRRLGVDENGLEEMDREVLRCLANAGGEAVGVKTIAATVGESEDTIEDVFEPHLLRCGFLLKTARGRLVTDAGRAAIGLPPRSDPEQASEQPDLFE